MRLPAAFVHPRSFMTLILLGFMVVALPLFVGLVVSSIQVGRLAQQSQDAVYRVVQATQGGRILVEQVIAMERSARQYLVLGDPARLQAYATTHREFQRMVGELSRLQPNDSQRSQLLELSEKEDAIFRQIVREGAGAQTSQAAVKQFAGLAQSARSLLAESNLLVDSQIETMRGMAERAQQLLFWQALALIPLSVAIAGIFFFLIAGPLRQLDRAIHRLGRGEFEEPIRIVGPRDLEELGDRLDWLRDRLRELEQQKNRFLQHVSHELKTPLTTVREGAGLLAGEVLGPLNQQQVEAASILQQSSLRLQRLIEDLLAFSRLSEVRGATLAKDRVPLDKLVEAVMGDYKLALRRKDITERVRLEAMVVQADAVKLKTAIDNLISNAVKYSPFHGQILVTLQTNGQEIHLDVCDSGPGVACEERERIFDAFYQAKNQPAGPVKGTGLGLGIARECALAHQGQISIIDDDAGGHFRLSLPIILRASAK